jgi:hypothetical protein
MKIFFAVMLLVAMSGYKIAIGNSDDAKLSLARPTVDSTDVKGVFMTGEELVYKVKYGIVRLGTVKIKTGEKRVVEGRDVYQCFAYIDSGELPFIKIHYVFDCDVDAQEAYSHRFAGRNMVQDSLITFRMRYTDGQIEIKSTHNDKVVYATTEPLQPHSHDGLSTIYFTRAIAKHTTAVDLPIWIETKERITSLKLVGKREQIETDLVDYPVKTCYLESEAKFVSIYGYSGRTQAWLSDDDARIPIIAKMKVLIGKVTVELESYTREGWTPPKSVGK